MNIGVLLAIFKRNFGSYFLNPTGYVFICVFVLLSSLAAFWPAEFFTSNLAGLDQLNRYFPLIMLIFVPAITMSMWAEERRQGTDELLLTIPATDFDVVMGKYLAAIAIYTVSLIFSAVCNIAVLMMLGNPDLGLMAATYIGYFFVGVAMLAVGMVASFLTSNITVGFVLGALFNSVLVGLEYVDLVLPREWAAHLKQYGIAEQLRDFTQGVVSVSAIAYFLSIVVVMLYLAMVLIGRRHWLGGRDGVNLGPHFLLRTLALGAAAVGLFLIAQHFPLRKDLSTEQLSALMPQTIKLVEAADPKRPIFIEAFISPEVPDEYIPVQLDLRNRLREMAAQSGGKITLRIVDTKPYSPESERAEKAYGITGREVRSVVRGRTSSEMVYMGVAISAGLDKQVIPFVELSTPIEYELSRSIAVLAGAAKKTLGIFAANKSLLRDVVANAQGQGELVEPAIMTELRHMYDVVELDGAKAVPANVDVLLAVQPSLCQTNQIDNLIAAIRRGVPTMIVEDPLALGFSSTVVQSELQRSGGAPFVQEGSSGKLWDLLGIKMETGQVVTHEYNPLPHFAQFPTGYVFIGNGALGRSAEDRSLFDESDPTSSGTKDLVFICPGSFEKVSGELDFKALVRTSTASGEVPRAALVDIQGIDQQGNIHWDFRRSAEPKPTGKQYVLAARIRGNPPPEDPISKMLVGDETGGTATQRNEIAQAPTPTATAAPTSPATPTSSATPTASATASPTGAGSGGGNPYALIAPTASATGTADKSAATPPAADKPKQMDVILIADLDVLASDFFSTRASRRQTAQEAAYTPPAFDNIAFVLNGLDTLAGDTRFIEVRKRRPEHRTLTTLEELEAKLRTDLQNAMAASDEQWEKTKKAAEAQWLEERNKLAANTTMKLLDKNARLRLFEQDQDNAMAKKERERARQRIKEFTEGMRNYNEEVRARQSLYKQIAVFVPPIFPLLIGLLVFFNRRAGEQEGVDRTRLK